MRLGLRSKLLLVSLALIAISVVAADLYLTRALDRDLALRIESDLAARLQRMVLVATAIALLVAVFMSSLAAHFMSRGLRALTHAARRMADGDLDARTGVHGRDEMAELGRALDHMAANLSHAVGELRRLEGVRKDFVANVSHELRTPIAAIRSAAETLDRAGAVAAPGREFSEIIARNAERLQRLVDDLLDLSRIESRATNLKPEPVPLAATVAQVLSLFEEKASRRRIGLRTLIPGDLPPLRADRRALEQVLSNLVDNAIKYSGEAAHITVRAEARAAEVRVTVEDTGPGIDAQHLPRLFERFYRVDAGRSRELGGTGLGLSIVKHLCESMGGAVEVDSRIGGGTRFSFTLPAAHG